MTIKKTKKKRGQAELNTTISLIIVVVSALIILGFWALLHFSNTTNGQVCHITVVLSSLTNGMIGKPNCKTNYVCISGGGTCSGINPSETVKVNADNKDEILKAIADKTSDCWSMFGEGNLHYVTEKFIGTKTVCAICDIVKFDDVIQQKYNGGTCLTNSIATGANVPPVTTPTTVTPTVPMPDLASVNSYNQYKSFFEKYKDIYNSLTSNQFKALLAAVAQENNWGVNTPGGSDWLMGFNTGTTDPQYKGAENQIKSVAQLFFIILKTPNALPSLGPYNDCSITNPGSDDRIECILSVYKTGKSTYTGGILAQKVEKSDGKTYADNVLALRDKWLNFFNGGSVLPVTPVPTTSPATPSSTDYSNCITYYDLYDYMEKNTISGNQQTYMNFLYGVDDKKSLFSNYPGEDHYKDNIILVGDEYAVITGNAKLNFAYIWGKEGWIHSALVDTNKFSSLDCDEYVTKLT